MRTFLICLLLLSFVNGALTDQLTAYYPMGQLDDVHSTYDLQIKGTVTAVSAVIGNGYDCDNTGVINASNVPIGALNWTINRWSKDQGFISSYVNPFARWSANAKPVQSFFNDAGTDRLYYYWGNGATQSSLTYDSNIDSSNFHMWTFRRKYISAGSGYNMSIYKDGVRVASTTSLTNVADDTSLPFYVCWHPGIGYSNMIVDEFGIWSRALSDTEITELYNGGYGLAYPFINYDFDANITVTNYTCGPANVSIFGENLDYFLVWIDDELYSNGTDTTQEVLLDFDSPGWHNIHVDGMLDGNTYDHVTSDAFFYLGEGYCLTESLNTRFNHEFAMFEYVVLFVVACIGTLILPTIISVPVGIGAVIVALSAFTAATSSSEIWLFSAVIPAALIFFKGRPQ